MIQKINDNAYFVIDNVSSSIQITNYDPRTANQTINAINFADKLDFEEVDIDKISIELGFTAIGFYYSNISNFVIPANPGSGPGQAPESRENLDAGSSPA